jgi:2-amino-4-hydroxy-6-hydroxymethyldihydropteridine diphosphokinase
MAREYWVALGSNLGNRLEHLSQAVREISVQANAADLRKSPVFETLPVGSDRPQENYLNAVICFSSAVAPLALLKMLNEIEAAHGRTRSEPNAPRTLDLDILLCDQKIIKTPELYTPHPRMAERAFVLAPMAALEPDQTIAGTGKVRDLLELQPQNGIKLFTESW